MLQKIKKAILSSYYCLRSFGADTVTPLTNVNFPFWDMVNKNGLFEHQKVV